MPPENRRASWVWAALCWPVLGVPAPAPADVFHLAGGDTIECEIVEDLGDAYRVRTLVGIVDIEKDRIIRHEKGPSPWQLYRKKHRKCPNTAEGHFKLAQWCRAHGLHSEQREHLEAAIRLDPQHAGARLALGYVKQDGRWSRPRSPNAPTQAELEARRATREEERLLRKLISQWFVKVKAIYRGRLAGENAGMKTERFRKGREQILAIRDPLAIPALTGVLSTGNVAARRVLLDALAQFDEDEATMNLVVMALLDPSPEVRRTAAIELLRRGDDRVVDHLRQALRSEEEHILRNAAAALGVLKARRAVPDLISVLSIQTRRQVRLSRPVYLDSIRTTFGGGRRRAYGSRLLYYRPGSIGVLGPGTMVGTETRYEQRTVSIYRTEAQEALISITGQNFGFDAAAWLEWWRRQTG